MTGTKPDGPDLRVRDRRIWELHEQDWSNGAIGAEFGISDERVRQILAKGPPDSAAELLETKLEAELISLSGQRAMLSRQIASVARRLDRLRGEREARDIDKLLGLT